MEINFHLVSRKSTRMVRTMRNKCEILYDAANRNNVVNIVQTQSNKMSSVDRVSQKARHSLLYWIHQIIMQWPEETSARSRLTVRAALLTRQCIMLRVRLKPFRDPHKRHRRYNHFVPAHLSLRVDVILDIKVTGVS